MHVLITKVHDSTFFGTFNALSILSVQLFIELVVIKFNHIP